MLHLLIGTDWTACRDEILARVSRDVKAGLGGRILMVPELISHEMERQLCRTAGDTASRYAEVLSFTYQEEKDRDYIAITKGPLTLGADSRIGKPADSVFDFAFDSNKLIYEKVESRELDCMVMYSFKDKNGNDIRLVDYASTGKDWKSTVAAWMKTK